MTLGFYFLIIMILIGKIYFSIKKFRSRNWVQFKLKISNLFNPVKKVLTLKYNDICKITKDKKMKN